MPQSKQRKMNNKYHIKAALIDMDGVLYDSMPNHARAWMGVMRHAGIKARPEEFFLNEGCTGAWMIDHKIREAFGRPATDEEKVELYALKKKFFVEQPPVMVMPGAQQMICELQRHGIVTVLVTGSGQNSLLDRLESDYPGAFPPERRVTSASVTHGKPHPEPYLRGLELAGVRADEAIGIDNAPLGVRSAHAAGVFTVGVVTGPVPSAELAAGGADIVYNSMMECAENISQLLER